MTNHGFTLQVCKMLRYRFKIKDTTTFYERDGELKALHYEN